MTIRHACPGDLPRIFEIYNASIPGRLATADTEPVTLASREGWFRDVDPARRPLWVHCDGDQPPMAWLSLRSFYGRPAYAATVEVGVYTAPEGLRQGRAKALLAHAVAAMNGLKVRTMLAYVFAHNAPSLALFERSVALAEQCNALLDRAELKVRQLVQGADGSISDQPFEGWQG